jgi:hypothetical protein
MTAIDFIEWSWTLATGGATALLIYQSREGWYDVVAARLVKPEENGRRGIYAMSRLRIRLVLGFITGMLTLTGIIAILTPNPEELTAARVATSFAADAIAFVVFIFVILDVVDSRRIATYHDRKSDRR